MSPYSVKKAWTRFRVKISYNGSKFHGWAIQPNVKTVQGDLQTALTKLYNIKITVYGSGRTDAGVHALEQVFHFDAPKHIKPQAIQHYLNSWQKGLWFILGVQECKKPFHARYDVKQKTYLYQIKCTSDLNPMLYDLVWQIHDHLSITKLKQVAKLFEGTHNFLSFTTEQKEDNVRTIYRITISQKNQIIFIKITGNGFLQSMVRMLVGTMVNYALGKIDLDQCKKLLSQPQKGRAVVKAPACGLYMERVRY